MDTNTAGASPLAKYSRQPKLYISLPSKGNWYNKATLQKVDEIEVYSMTASDEIALKTPDGLITGNSVVEVIKNCIPDIKDPWMIPMIDFDYILASIRLASYGENVATGGTCPKCSNVDTFEIAVQSILDHIDNVKFQTDVAVNNFTVRIRPLYYKETTEVNKIATTVQRAIMQQIPNIEDEDERQKHIQSLYAMINQSTLDATLSGIVEVVTPEGESETNPITIREFISNTDPIFYNRIQEAYKENTNNLAIPKSKVACGECEHEYEVSTNLDQANFFGGG
jgi:hypothetical protein|tara:strand:- start:1772 stop:2617 length:846 start_codon:yes stop_codon:yes gene_type:complete